jgi:uncharacterized SAM-binding protein YcdF (DUF218 family)
MPIADIPPKAEALPRSTDQDRRIFGSPSKRVFPYLFWTVVAGVLLLVSFLQWGGNLLISNDPLTVGVDGAVVLEGSILGEKARLAGAVALLQQGKVNRVLVGVPGESYWGERIAPIARAYIEKTYGTGVAAHIEFCEVNNVNSTEEEAEVLTRCIDARHWESVAIVTSYYHTRRAKIIWRRVLQKQHSALIFRIHGVADPEFHARGWWRDRLSAKTWFFESTKLLWTFIE